MATAHALQDWSPHPVEPWPADDTEESILGTDLHQGTITSLRLGLNGAARLSRTPGAPVPWQALTQLLLLGCRHPDGSQYRTYPDVFVYPRAMKRDRGSYVLETDGAPAMIAEVLSQDTYTSDIDLVRGKGYTYALAGVAEYLVVDPTGLYLPEGIRAWRLASQGYVPWEPAADGRHYSTQFPLAFGLNGTLAEIYLADGRRMYQEDEIEEAIVQRDAEIEQRDAEIARLQRLLENR
jgi:hypothetical protein